MKQVFNIVLIVICMTAVSCDRGPELRRYTEVIEVPPTDMANMPNPHGNMFTRVDPSQRTDDPNLQRMLDASVADVDLLWERPAEWDEQKGSGMRLATFNSRGADPIQCTIVSLSGSSGGVAANVTRWIRQLGAQPPSAEALTAFLARQEAIGSQGDLAVQLIDLTEFASAESSMYAAIIETTDKTIFIKMTGTAKSVSANIKPFQELCRSLKIRP